MFPILYDENEITYGSVPQNMGLGILNDALSCIITEERNGSYELTLTYPASGKHANELVERRLIKAKPNFTDNPQLFRIYKVGKVMGSNFTIYARHISYDLSGKEIISGTAGSCVAACDLLSTNDFIIDTNKNVNATFTITEPSSRRSWLAGKEGSLLDIYGTGEYHFDNFNIHLLLHRGTNRGVTVRYAKNLLSLDQQKDASNLATHIILYYKKTDENILIYSSKVATGITLDTEQVKCIDVSSDYSDTEPTVADLNAKANQTIQNNNYTIPTNNLKLDFLQLKTLKDRVDLCDTVTIYYEQFGINVSAKCIKTTWNVLLERYDSIELGDPKSNIVDTFINSSKETQKIIQSTASQLQQSINNATSLITGNSGGYVVIHDSNGDGYPDEILIMNTPDINTATKVWRWNNSGLGYSSTGYAGNYGLAMTIDGQIVANYITTGTMSANRVRTGLLQDTSGTNYFDLDSGQAHFERLDIKVGNQVVDAGTIIGQKVDTSQIRTAFAADSTSITISSGTITFNADSFIVNATNLEIDAHGNVKSSSFKSNESIEFYDENWGLKFLDIGSYYDSTGTVQIPYLRMYDDNGDILTELKTYIDSNGRDLGVLHISGRRTSTAKDMVDIQGSYIRMYSNYEYNNIPRITIADAGRAFYDPDTQQWIIDTSAYVKLNNGNDQEKILLDAHDGKITCVSLTQTSSKKYKKNIRDLSDKDAKRLLNVKPVIYDFKNPSEGKDHAGFIAEDIEAILPEVVTKNDKGEAEGINYTEMIAYLTKMIQLQQEQIDALKEKTQ